MARRYLVYSILCLHTYIVCTMLTTVQMMTTHARTGAGAQNSLKTLDNYNY